MEKERKTRILAIVAILIAIVSTSVGFATFTETLNISGSATANKMKWQIRFENLGEAELVGAAAEVTKPSINTNDTTMGDFDVTFSEPGDSVSYTFDIANNGTFDSEITTIEIPTPTCTGTGETAETDAKNVCKYLTYSFKYFDAETSVVGDTVAMGDALDSGDVKTVILTLSYSDQVQLAELPVNDVSIDNLGFSIIYSQK